MKTNKELLKEAYIRWEENILQRIKIMEKLFTLDHSIELPTPIIESTDN